MHDNDLAQILNSSKETLVTIVKKWRIVSRDKTTFSAIVLEELGAWDSIAESIDDFCSEYGSNWGSMKVHFFSRHQVSDFKEFKTKIEKNSTSGSNLNNEEGFSISTLKDSGDALKGAGDALKKVANAFSTILWSSIIGAVIVVILFISNMNLESAGVAMAIGIIQIFFGLIILASFGNIIVGLRKAGNHLNNHTK